MFNDDPPICSSAEVFAVKGSNTIYVNFSGNFGFGQISFRFDTERNKIAINNEFLGKEEIKAIFNKMIDSESFLNDFTIENKDTNTSVRGEWKKETTILKKEDADVLFKKIKNKQYFCKSDDFKDGKFLTSFEDGDITYIVVSSKHQNKWNDFSEDSKVSRFFDLFTSSIEKTKDPIFESLLGFEVIKKVEWVKVPMKD